MTGADAADRSEDGDGGEGGDPDDGGGHADGGGDEDVVDELFAVIESRKEELPEDSYTASLFTHEKGEDAVLEKLGEETTELLLAAKGDDADALAHEAADVVYHLLVLLSMNDLTAEDLRAELRARR